MTPRELAFDRHPSDNELLVSILAELRGLRADLAKHRVAPSARDGVAPLLEAIALAVGARAFSTAELVVHASLPIAADLRAAIIASIGTLNAQRLGKRLKSVEGANVGGLIVRRLGSDRDGVVWRIEAAPIVEV